MKSIIFIFFVFAFFLLPTTISAHPGRTASDGCHYCRTNCDSWGVAWNQRHCHGGTTAPAPVKTYTPPPATYVAPATPRPTPKPTPTPTPWVGCSAIEDNLCPNHCTAGNDSDCCTQKLDDHRWYDNWGCYPEDLLCSDVADGVCHWYCSAGNDADCCTEKLPTYKWYDNWGCYPAE